MRSTCSSEGSHLIGPGLGALHRRVRILSILHWSSRHCNSRGCMCPSTKCCMLTCTGATRRRSRHQLYELVTYPWSLNVEKWLQNCEQSTLKDKTLEHIEGYISFVLCIAAGEVVNELVWFSDGKKHVSGGRKFAGSGRWWKAGWLLRRDAQPYVPVGRYRVPAIFLELRLDPQFVYIDLRWPCLLA